LDPLDVAHEPEIDSKKYGYLLKGIEHRIWEIQPGYILDIRYLLQGFFFEYQNKK
jgi:hypothetical protein